MVADAIIIDGVTFQMHDLKPVRPRRGARVASSIKSAANRVADHVDPWALANTAFGTIGTLSFGFYTGIFVLAGGWFWLWAIPYAVLTGLCLGWTVWNCTQIWN